MKIQENVYLGAIPYTGVIGENGCVLLLPQCCHKQTCKHAIKPTT